VQIIGTCGYVPFLLKIFEHGNEASFSSQPFRTEGLIDNALGCQMQKYSMVSKPQEILQHKGHSRAWPVFVNLILLLSASKTDERYLCSTRCQLEGI